MADQPNPNLAQLLESRLRSWEESRKPQELKMLECYQDVLRIPRADDTQNTGAARARKAQSLFIGSTRNKVRAARAKIIDALFGSGNMPFDTTPTDESLAPYADVMEDIITEQMERGKFKDLLKTGVNTLATYGTGFIFGPFQRKETITETAAETLGGSTYIKESKYEFDMPYFELGNTLDVYPDPEGRDDFGLGVFWATMESKHTVAAWKDLPGYKNIEFALIGPGDRGNETGSEIAAQLRGNIDYWFKNDRIKVARFFGKVAKSALSGQGESFETVTEDMVDVIIIMAGGVVVKIDKNPYGGKNPTHRAFYEAAEHEGWGVGVAENNSPHQKVTNAAFRLFMEGKGMALLGTTSVDRSKFLPTEDFKKFPGKVYQFKPGLSPDDRKSAIEFHAERDITEGWIDVIRMSEQFSDDDTGITKYTQGDDSRNLNKTATGISMIMSASSLPMKEVIQNIDSQWIEPIVECYIDWNLKYLEPETVLKIHGEEKAALWAQIKQFGKSSFMDWQATGTASFMQKEVLTNKIRAFSEFALGNPLTAEKIDVTELLQQTWDVMEIGRESPILDPKKPKPGAPLPPDVLQRMEQVSMHVEQLEGQLQQTTEAAQKEIDRLSQELAKKESDLMKAEIEIKEKDSLLVVRDAESAAMEAINNAKQASEQVEKTPQQPMIMPDVNGQMAQAMQPIAEMLQMNMQSNEEAQAAAADAQATAQATAQEVIPALQELASKIEGLIQQVNAPRSVVRDKTGAPVGVQVGDTVRPINRDENGRISGY